MTLQRTTSGRYVSSSSSLGFGVAKGLVVTRINGTDFGPLEFSRRLGQLAELFRDMQPMLEAVAGRGYYPIVQLIFDTEDRGKWPDLTSKYGARKSKLYGDRPILQATGRLMVAMTTKGAPGNVHKTVGQDQLLLGSDLPYAGWAQQHGRPITDFTDSDFAFFTDIAVEELLAMASESGFDVRELK